MKHFLIVTGGTLDAPFLKTIYSMGEFDKVISADHGLDALIKADIVPDYVLGDFDSIKTDVKAYCQKYQVEFLAFPPEKDYTDTHLAFVKAIELGAGRITVLGATGTRIDHMLANLSMLSISCDHNVFAQIIDPYNRISMIEESICLSKREQYGNFVSLIPYTDQVRGIDLSGFKYPLVNGSLDKKESRGISNEITDPTATITIKSGRLLVIESRDTTFSF